MLKEPSQPNSANSTKHCKAILATARATLRIATFVALTFSSSKSFAAGQKCNVNEHCKIGWYCVKGNPSKGDARADLEGFCKPNIIARQLCTIDKALMRIVGRFAVLFGAIAVGWSLLQGKFELKSVITMIIGAVFILAPFSVLSVVTRRTNSACDFEMTIPDLGFLPV